MVDINTIRDPAIQMHGLLKADEKYTLYYDETNNIRRLYVKPDGLNVAELNCFVIAGIAHHGEPKELPLNGLRSLMHLQNSVKELKLKHIGKGDFLSILKSQKLGVFLQWLHENSLFIHFSVLDPLYWSIVDIIDSILGESRDPRLYQLHLQLKNNLYTILRHDLQQTIILFRKYSYPNVGRQRRPEFIADLQRMLQKQSHLLDSFNLNILEGLLELTKKLNSLPFLVDETPNILIDSLSPFFIERICILKHATHILDIEEIIQDKISSFNFSDNGKRVENFHFADSKSENGIQLSDLIAGFLGKFFTYINKTEPYRFPDIHGQFSKQQKSNLHLFKKLTERSIAENPIFSHTIISLEDIIRQRVFLSYI